MALAVLAAMALDTHVVRIGSTQDQRAAAFDAGAWGRKAFPAIAAQIEGSAVDAAVLSAAIAEDKAAAGEKYGKPGSVGPIFAVRFTGSIDGDGRSGIFNLLVDGLPAGQKIRVQTGPAINGTDLRDATGTVDFGQFTNQMEYQDAGAALNAQVKAQVIGKLDRAALAGKKVQVTGVFQLINASNWLVTPVQFKVAQP
nr:DUF2291 domain-containing protein [Pelomonas sp. KK5]